MPMVQVFDSAMCCTSGVCGPQVDPALVRFSADLDWLKSQGITVERFNLSQSPAAFVANPLVSAAMRERDDALPLILVDGKIVARSAYPARDVIAGFVGLDAPKSIFSDAVQELVAIGAAIASNCEPCFKFHYDKARKLGVSKEDMARAVSTAKAVKESPARSVIEVAEKYLGIRVESDTACCPPSDTAPVAIGMPASAPKKCC